ncbi:MAG: hypothetical protein IH609_18205 [Dehalococcoidia bacterium]|nr:hypothetical protein [Dehalococcoidia bacterium]
MSKRSQISGRPGQRTRAAPASLGTSWARGQQLAEFPWSGRVIPEFQTEHLREVLEQGFRILYEVFPDRIEVFGMISSRRNLAE